MLFLLYNLDLLRFCYIFSVEILIFFIFRNCYRLSIGHICQISRTSVNLTLIKVLMNTPCIRFHFTCLHSVYYFYFLPNRAGSHIDKQPGPKESIESTITKSKLRLCVLFLTRKHRKNKQKQIWSGTRSNGCCDDLVFLGTNHGGTTNRGTMAILKTLGYNMHENNQIARCGPQKMIWESMYVKEIEVLLCWEHSSFGTMIRLRILFKAVEQSSCSQIRRNVA